MCARAETSVDAALRDMEQQKFRSECTIVAKESFEGIARYPARGLPGHGPLAKRRDKKSLLYMHTSGPLALTKQKCDKAAYICLAQYTAPHGMWHILYVMPQLG